MKIRRLFAIGTDAEYETEDELYDAFVEDTCDEDGIVDDNYFRQWVEDLVATGDFELIEN